VMWSCGGLWGLAELCSRKQEVMIADFRQEDRETPSSQKVCMC
jgi:hypothetical protein